MATPRTIKSAARRRAMQQVMTATNASRRALVYVRQSLDRTGEGAGIERQEEACRALCKARGWEVVAVIDDTISATSFRLEQRPGWSRAIDMIERGEVDVIVVYHLDRLTRSMKDLEALIDMAVNRGVGVATAQGDIDLTTDVGRMVGRILAAVAQAEGERKAERMILANDQRIEAGVPQWIRRPFGFEMIRGEMGNVESIELNTAESDAIRRAYADVITGKSLSAIAAEWNVAGFRTSAPDPESARPRAPRQRAYSPSGEWGGVAVRKVLESARNAGLIEQYGEVMGAGNWPAIVTVAEWRAVKRLFDDRQRPDSKSGKLAHLLSGIARCADCGATMRATRRAGDDSNIYQCSGHDARPGETGRGHVSIPVDFADEQTLAQLASRMLFAGRLSFRTVAPPEDVAPLQTRLTELNDIMAQFMEDLANRLITRIAYQAGTANIREEMQNLNARIAEAGRRESLLESESVQAELARVNAAWHNVLGAEGPEGVNEGAGALVGGTSVRFGRMIADEFKSFDLMQQREILRDAFVSIEILGRGKGRPRAGKPAYSPKLVRVTFSPEWDFEQAG